MNKLFLVSLLISSLAQANVSTVAVTEALNDNDLIVPITLNNQSNSEISSNSEFIPSEAKIVAPQDALIFQIKIPNVTGTKRIRYTNSGFGCDFYIDVLNNSQMMPSMAYITGVPINNGSMCNVFNVGGVNHLTVSFIKINV
ncbi:MAG: hypothetical protein H0U57_05860 [Tatlockia sp.]|nr:hypothetical protein [Tatlockia sp.]